MRLVSAYGKNTCNKKCITADMLEEMHHAQMQTSARDLLIQKVEWVDPVCGERDDAYHMATD
jgi:hypothetical protein